MLQDLWTQLTQTVGERAPGFLAALLILVVGWLVALALAAIVRGGLKRTTLDERLAAWLKPEGEPMPIARYASKGVFYLVMLFVLVAFFQALNLTLITEPLNALLTQLTEYAPRILGAGFLLAVAWIVATILKKLVAAGLGATKLDSKLSEGAEAETAVPVSNTIAEAVYWLIFLLFLPAILGALALDGLLSPVEGLLDRLLGFLPNLFAAAIIFVIGWFVARLVQRIISNLLAAAGADRLAARVGLDDALGETRLSGLLGLVVYVLILIPVLISALNALQLEAITTPASAMLGSILDAIPGLFAAGLLITLAYFVGRLVSGLISNLLQGAGFDNLLAKLGLGRAQPDGGRTPSDIVGTLILIAIMLFASIEAAGVLGFEMLSELISGFVVFGGQIVLGLIILGIGLFLANVAADAIESSAARQRTLLAVVARLAIVVLAGAMALRQMGLADDIINLAFGLLLGAIAVAAALAFGLGGREVAGEHVRNWMSSLKGGKS